MKKLLLLLFILCTNCFGITNSQSLAFGVYTKSGFCSATLIKVDGECQMVTNAHCLQNNEDRIILKSARDFMPDHYSARALTQSRRIRRRKFDTRRAKNKDFLWNYEKKIFSENEYGEMSAMVTHINRSKDLARIEIPMDVRIHSCTKLKETKVPAKEDLESGDSSIVLAGFTKDKVSGNPHAKVWTTRDTDFERGLLGQPNYKASKISFTTSTLPNVENFIEVEDIKMLPGNSGGMAQSDDGEFVGVTTRFHPTQDKVFIIPAQDVVDFVKNPTTNLETQGINNRTIEVGGNSGTGGTGGNSGTGGGGNSGTGGGSCIRFEAENIFVEPYEGYVDNFGKVLLAVNGNQIDGSDDLKDHYSGKTENLITRSADGYPSIEVRKNLLTRLNGEYNFESVKKDYDFNSDHVLANEEVSYEKGSTSIRVSDDRIIIKKTHGDQPEEDQIKESYNIEVSEDYKTITLRRGDITLSCDNRNYLKLICKSDKESLSLSLDALKEGKASFRHTIGAAEASKTYFYGNQ